MSTAIVAEIASRASRLARLHAGAQPFLTGPHAVGQIAQQGFYLLLHTDPPADSWVRLADMLLLGATSLSDLGHVPIAQSYAGLAGLLRQEAAARR